MTINKKSTVGTSEYNQIFTSVIDLEIKINFLIKKMCKWGLVIAALKDLNRPAELLSPNQCASIAATGYIYSRFSMVIIPKNYTLLSVNVFVAITQTIQLFRALNYKYQHGELFAKPKVDVE